MPTYSREFKTLGVRKDKIGGRIRYFDVALRQAHKDEQNRKPGEKLPKAA